MTNLYTEDVFAPSTSSASADNTEILERLDELSGELRKERKKRKRLHKKLGKATKKNKKLKKHKNKGKRKSHKHKFLGVTLASLPAALALTDTVLRRQKR